jgi:phage replication-related protein YjqB (UPF0714/DUF867 family)
MFDELLRHPGVTEELELRSPFGFMAFHGGSLERGTDGIAREAARRSGSSYYGVLQPDDFRWHVPSTAFRPEHSTSLGSFLDHVAVVVTVHGYGREGMFTTVLLGGRNRELAMHLAAELRPALPHYAFVDQLDEIPSPLRGLHPENPVNRPVHDGVQVELPPRIRGQGPYWADWDGPGCTPHTDALITALARAATSWSHR